MSLAAFDGIERAVAEVLAGEARGPRQNGVFAIWLVARAAAGLVPPEPVSTRGHARRIIELERRLSSLSLPALLRRGLQDALERLRDPKPGSAAVSLEHLAEPAREALGDRMADALMEASRAAGATR